MNTRLVLHVSLLKEQPDKHSQGRSALVLQFESWLANWRLSCSTRNITDGPVHVTSAQLDACVVPTLKYR